MTAFTAVVVDAVRAPGSETELLRLSERSGAGTFIEVLNPPGCGMRGIIGTRIHGTSTEVLVDSTVIAERVGNRKMRLLEPRRVRAAKGNA